MPRAQLLILFAALALGCVDPVDLSLPAAELPLILEGNITDNPSAPDTIRLSYAYPADGKYHRPKGVSGATFWITDESGAKDVLIDLHNGKYVTDQLQGSIGKTYTLNGRLPDGTTITSSPQLMSPAGIIDSIYYEVTSVLNPETGIHDEGLNVFINASVAASSHHRMRWKFNGTYIYISDPSLIVMFPLACAADCSCCTCWASERETSPLVSNPTFETGPNINKVFVRYIPVNGFTFYEKYRVEITQMELSSDVFEYYTDIKKQIENAASLFQPPFFALDGNISKDTGNTKVIGVFSAAAEVKSVRYILRSEVRYTGSTVLAGDCRAVIDHSTNVPPPYWN